VRDSLTGENVIEAAHDAATRSEEAQQRGEGRGHCGAAGADRGAGVAVGAKQLE